jgi:nucleotide-binding universal stress UspA family protein
MVTFKRILVPVDFGAATQEVLAMAVSLAKEFGATLSLVHVWELPSYAYAGLEFTPSDLITPIQETARSRLEELVSQVRKDVPQTEGVLRPGTAWREILATIEETTPDLVVMGTHGRKGVPRMFIGSVAEKIVRTSPVPVLTVHGAGRSEGPVPGGS